MKFLSGETASVAVLVPCFNEEKTIASVVESFARVLPDAAIYVFDNASTDATAARAAEAGAQVVLSPLRGKGHVVQHMFKVVEADFYLMVDGDATYPAEAAPQLLALLQEGNFDMVVGNRVTPEELLASAYRPMHRLGNRMVCWLISRSFRSNIRDVFSGYRVFGREFVKNVPLGAGGFQIEVEMTLQALSKGFRLAERNVAYGVRPAGSVSKLNTWKDGLLVLFAFASICRDYRPGLFFGLVALFFLVLSLAAGALPILDYINYRYVYRVPLALMATGLAILSALSLTVSFVLQTQLRYHNELHALIRSKFRG